MSVLGVKLDTERANDLRKLKAAFSALTLFSIKPVTLYRLMTLWCCTSTMSSSLIFFAGFGFFGINQHFARFAHLASKGTAFDHANGFQIHLSTLIVGNHIDFTVKIITMSAMKKIPLLML